MINRRSSLRPIGQARWRYVAQPPEHWLLVAQIPALVSEEQFQQVQEKLSHNQRCARRNNRAHDYLLRALVSCGHCQLTATGRAQGAYSYYVCKGKNKKPCLRWTCSVCSLFPCFFLCVLCVLCGSNFLLAATPITPALSLLSFTLAPLRSPA